jgi:hypothetical protein
MTASIVLCEDGAAWDRLVEQTCGWPTLLWGWNQQLAERFGLEFHPLACVRDGQIRDVFPLLVDRRGRLLWSGGLDGAGGCMDAGNMAQFCGAARSVLPGASLRVETRLATVQLPGAVTLLNHHAVAELSGFADFSDWLSKLRPTVRRQYNKGKRLGLRIEQATPQQFHEVYAALMDSKRAAVLPADWFARLAASFGNHCGITVTQLDGQVVGASFLLETEGELYDYFIVSDPAHRASQANTFQFVRLFEMAFERGARRVNLGPSVAGDSITQFKETFGAELIPVRLLVLPANPGERLYWWCFERLRQFMFAHPGLWARVRKVVGR